MSMIRKIIPVSLYDIPGLGGAGWRSRPARVCFPPAWAPGPVFEDRGLPGTRFRLDPSPTGSARGWSPQRKSWSCTGRPGGSMPSGWAGPISLFYTTDPQAPELFSDYQGARSCPWTGWSRTFAPTADGRLCCGACLVSCSWPSCFLGHSYDVQPDHFVRLPLILLQLFNPVLLFFPDRSMLLLPPHRPPGPQDPVRHLQRSEGGGFPPPRHRDPAEGSSGENIAALILSPVLVPLVLYLQFGDGRLTTRPVAGVLIPIHLPCTIWSRSPGPL